MESARAPKPSKRRIDSDDEDEGFGEGSRDDHPVRLRGKRGRTEESSVGGGDTGMDDEVDADMNIDIEADPDDTRFLPPPFASTSASPPPLTKASKRSTSSAPSKARGKSATSSSSRSSARKPKRTVVWTDSEEDGEEYQDAGQVMDPEDEDFSPEPRPTTSKKAAATAKVKHGKLTTGKGTKNNAKKNDKEIVIRDERKIPPPATSTPKEKPSMPTGSKRPPPKDEDEDMDIDVSGTTRADSPDKSKVAPPTKLEDPAPPPLKKRKLPTIKKNKTSTAPSTPSTAKPSISDEKKDATTTATTASTLVGVAARKPAATAGNADFDLRDKSVYAQLFNKVRSLGPIVEFQQVHNSILSDSQEDRLPTRV